MPYYYPEPYPKVLVTIDGQRYRTVACSTGAEVPILFVSGLSMIAGECGISGQRPRVRVVPGLAFTATAVLPRRGEVIGGIAPEHFRCLVEDRDGQANDSLRFTPALTNPSLDDVPVQRAAVESRWFVSAGHVRSSPLSAG